jgi:2-hydroxycyclohexanecarboxyl-CoA dehydrogenase
MSLEGKTAVVTGGGSGIGQACALQLARDGAKVAVWDLNEEATHATVAMIAAEGNTALACVGNAATKAGITASAKATRDAFGPVTVLVNNAGMTGHCAFLDLTEEDWDKMIGVNLKGPFLCSQEFIPDMLAAGWGRIVNISSSSAQGGSTKMVHYTSSKGGVIGFTKALAMELAPTGITVNNIPPGFIDTPMMRGFPLDVEKAAAASPMKRPGLPEDIAFAASYLCSPGAKYVTGQTLSVNGGRYLL